MTPARFMVAGAIGVLLYVARAAFIPVFLALLFALTLSIPVEWLHRLRVPRGLGAAVILALTLALITTAANFLWAPVTDWVAAAPQTARIVKERVRPLTILLNRVDVLKQSAASIGETGRSAGRTQVVAAPARSTSVLLLDTMRGVLVSSVAFIAVTLFLLAGGQPMLTRMTAAFADDQQTKHTLGVIGKVRTEVGRFYATTALINLGLGCATTIVMAAWGMPTPYLWGVMATVLNFIPYAGSTMVLLVVTLVALVSFDSLGTIFGVAGSYLTLATIEGQIVAPLLVGRRLALNPLLVFLALWFGGLYWGVAGIILATPALVVLKMIAENTSGGRPMLEFLGPNDQTAGRDDKLHKLTGTARTPPQDPATK
jgi:predicted PurR-regulated permease PerM